jgi:hypothetical protein
VVRARECLKVIRFRRQRRKGEKDSHDLAFIDSP